MKLNQQKVDEAVLAVFWLTLHDKVEAWKDNRLGHYGSVAPEGIHF